MYKPNYIWANKNKIWKFPLKLIHNKINEFNSFNKGNQIGYRHKSLLVGMRSTMNSTCSHDFSKNTMKSSMVLLLCRDFTRHTALAFHTQHNIVWQRRYTSTSNLRQIHFLWLTLRIRCTCLLKMDLSSSLASIPILLY